jgi:DNA-binding protein HU-beta
VVIVPSWPASPVAGQPYTGANSARRQEAAEISKKQAAAAVEALVAMACKGAKVGFTVPGLGKLLLVNRKARMGRNPATGEAIKIKAKRVVKFRVAKACKDAILG